MLSKHWTLSTCVWTLIHFEGNKKNINMVTNKQYSSPEPRHLPPRPHLWYKRERASNPHCCAPENEHTICCCVLPNLTKIYAFKTFCRSFRKHTQTEITFTATRWRSRTTEKGLLLIIFKNIVDFFCLCVLCFVFAYIFCWSSSPFSLSILACATSNMRRRASEKRPRKLFKLSSVIWN